MSSFLVAAATSWLCLYFSHGAASVVFEKALSSFTYVAALFGALSFALYNSVESVLKDLPEELKNVKPQAYSDATDKFTHLKTEIISNVALIISLLVLAKILFGIEDIVMINKNIIFSYFTWVIISFRAACFAVCLYAIFTQCMGFLVINDSRGIIKKGY